MEDVLGAVLLMTVKSGLRVLVLDDEKVRHDWFEEQAEELGWAMTHTWTAAECVLKLQEGPWDIVFLDHDLGEWTGGWEDTRAVWGPCGTVAARYISGPLPMKDRPAHVHIHSWNPSGADDIEAELKRAGVPYSRMEFGKFKLVRKAA